MTESKPPVWVSLLLNLLTAALTVLWLHLGIGAFRKGEDWASAGYFMLALMQSAEYGARQVNRR